jgi:hypothetical protein
MVGTSQAITTPRKADDRSSKTRHHASIVALFRVPFGLPAGLPDRPG